MKMSFLALCFAFAGIAQAQTVATVGNAKIDLKDFNAKYKMVIENTTNPPAKELFLEDLVRYEMGLQEAQKQNIMKDPMVQERINQVLYQSFIEKEIGKKVNAINVSEAEMKKYYSSNPEVRTSHILIQFKPGAAGNEKVETRKRAESILKEVKSSKRSFEELVALYTDDIASKRSGGDIGWQTRVTLAPRYYQAAIELDKNEISGLIETEFGFHIIKLVEKNDYESANKRHIRQVVFDIKRKQIFDAYFAGLSKKYPTQKNPNVLK